MQIILSGKRLSFVSDDVLINRSSIRRGQLTPLGHEEHFQMGVRLYHRLKPLFNSSNSITVVTSGKKRAVDSSEAFINGLIECDAMLSIAKSDPNKHLLYFHKSCTDYITFKKSNSQVKSILESIKMCDRTRDYAREVLRRIYHDEFVDLLIDRNYQVSSEDQPKNEVEFVLCLYSMFVVAPAQSEPRMKRMLAKYFTEEQSNWFAYIHDAEVR